MSRIFGVRREPMRKEKTDNQSCDTQNFFEYIITLRLSLHCYESITHEDKNTVTYGFRSLGCFLAVANFASFAVHPIEGGKVEHLASHSSHSHQKLAFDLRAVTKHAHAARWTELPLLSAQLSRQLPQSLPAGSERGS